MRQILHTYVEKYPLFVYKYTYSGIVTSTENTGQYVKLPLLLSVYSRRPGRVRVFRVDVPAETDSADFSL